MWVRLGWPNRPGGPELLSGAAVSNQISVTDDAGTSYTFDKDGLLLSAVSAVDDRSPAATQGATRQTTTVSYDSQPVGAALGETRVTVSGLSTPSGFTEKSNWDAQWREREIVDASGRVTQIVYDGVSDRVSYTDTNFGTTQAIRSSTIYDTSVVFNGLSRPVASYGPAPVGLFTGATPNAGGEVYPYPVRPAFRGAPKVHQLWAPAYSGANWVGGSPDPQIPVDNFSGRLSGLINAATAGSYQFGSWGAQGTRVTIDNTMVIDGWNSNGTSPQSAPITLSAGWHRISVDIKANTGYSAFDVTWKTPGSGLFAFIPMTSLKPDLGLVTSTVSPTVNAAGASDSVTTQNTYANPVVGALTKSVVDPIGLKLTSSSTFEAQGTPNQFLRQLTSTLPAGWDAGGNAVAQPGGGTQAATVTNTYYAKTEAGPTSTGCAGVSTNQAGRLRSSTKADPDGTGVVAAIVDEVAYDNTGRPVAARTVGDSAWTCTVYDSRGRVTSVAYPAFTNPSDATLNTLARTVTTTYSVGGNPLVTKTTDPNTGTPIRITTDLLGRVYCLCTLPTC